MKTDFGSPKDTAADKKISSGKKTITGGRKMGGKR